MQLRATVAVGLTCLILAGCKEKSSLPKYTVNDPKNPNTTWRAETPLSYREAIANGHCPILLPKEAKNIQFVDFYAGYGGFRQYVRFEAPAEICKAQARLIISNFDSKITMKSLHVSIIPAPLSVEQAQAAARGAKAGEVVAQAPWFDSDAIQKGEVWGDGKSHTPEIFVDLQKGVFYYSYSD